MDIKIHTCRTLEGLHVSSFGLLNLPGTNDVIDTQLDFIFQKGDQTKLSEDESEETSGDDARPTTPVAITSDSAAPKSLTPEIVVTNNNNKPLSFKDAVHKERKISTIIKNMQKTPTRKEMADFIVYPDGALSYYWMSLVALSVMYNIATVIMRLSFDELRDHKIFYLLDNVSDAVYLVDIFVQTRTAFLEEGCLVTNPHAMFQHYRKKAKFWLDIVATFPASSIYWLCCVLVNVVTLKFSSLFTIAPVPALRFLRILKYHQVDTFFEIADGRTRRPSLLRAFKLSLHLSMVIHWIACIYYIVSEFEGRGTNDWVYTNDESGGFRRKYIRSVYWSMMTLTTIGERPSPETDLEYIFTGLTFLIGVFVFAAVVGNVGDVISNMNAARHDFQSRMDQIKFYMNHRIVPEDLQDRVKKWAEYSWTRTQAMDEPSVLAMLPDRLRTEIAIHVHLETLKQVKIFEECEEGLLRELVLKLRPQIYSPGDYICRTGEIGREMYIINHGRIEILVPKGILTTRVALLKPGNYFGEISLLKLDEGQNRRTADVRAIGYSELLCLSRKDLISALGEYPEAKKILESQAMQRMQETKDVRKNEGETTKSHITAGKPGAPLKKKASEVFSKVMKQEGFRKLLSSRDNEMAELRKLILEIKDISHTRKEPASETLKERCKTLEQRLTNKEATLKQAKRRINQLETYVRIRAYNAKFQKYNVPLSDPKESTVLGPNTLYSQLSQQSNVTNNQQRMRKLSGNLETVGRTSVPSEADHEQAALIKSITQPGQENGVHQPLPRQMIVNNNLSSTPESINLVHVSSPKTFYSCSTITLKPSSTGNAPRSSVSASNNSNRFSQVRKKKLTSSKSFDNSNQFRPIILNGNLKSSKSYESLTTSNGSSSHTSSHGRVSNGFSDSAKPMTNGSVISQGSSRTQPVNGQCLNKNGVKNGGTHVSTVSFMIGAPQASQNRHTEIRGDLMVTSPKRRLYKCVGNIKISGSATSFSQNNHLTNGETMSTKTARPLLKFTKRHSEETNDSGISDKDFVNEEEELIQLMELFSAEQSSLDSISTSLSLSENDSELSSEED